MRRIYSLIVAVSLVLLTVTVVSLLQTEQLWAIPAFARKYQMSCTTCHAPFPSLKPYGDEFAGNGFVLKDKDAPRYTVETGDPNLSLIRELPFAIRMEGFATYNSASERDLDFTAPYLLKLLSGGTLTKNVAYYFYFFLSERGEVAGLEDAFVMFNNLGGSEVDLYVGQFQVSDPLFKREVRLEFEDYQIYRVKPFGSGINLTYDRGVMLTWGLPSQTDLTLEVLNGNGIGHADEYRLYDDDKYKCVAGRLSQGLGDYLRIGGFGYFGKEGVESLNNEVTMIGPDLTLGNDRLTFNLQYLERRDKEFRRFPRSQRNSETRGAFGELVYWPNGDRSRWFTTALFNWVESDDRSVEYRTLSLDVGHLLRTNIRLVGSLTYDLRNDETRLVAGVVTAF